MEISGEERNSLIIAIASLSSPSLELIRELEDMIMESSETTNLLLAYGALVANVAPDIELEMVSFLMDRIPEDITFNNLEVLIHLINALGNTKSELAVEYIIQYTDHDDEAVRLSAVTALRFFTGMSIVQEQLFNVLLQNPSESLVSVLIGALSEGVEISREMTINEDFIALLTNFTISFNNHDLHIELIRFFKRIGTAETLVLAHILEMNTYDSRQRRATSSWNSTYSPYSLIASLSSRLSDYHNFTTHRAYLNEYKIGKTTGTYKLYLQAVVGLFAGVNESNSDFKIFGKAVLRGYVLNRRRDVIKVEGSFKKQNEQYNGKLYVRIGNMVLYDYDHSGSRSSRSVSLSFSQSYQISPIRKTLFSFTYPIVIYIVTLDLDISVHIGLSGSVDVSVEPRGIGAHGTLSIGPTATASAEARVSLNFLWVCSLEYVLGCNWNNHFTISAH